MNEAILLTIGATVLLMLSPMIHATEAEHAKDGLHRLPPMILGENHVQKMKGLEQRMSPEERQRLNYDLQNQAGVAYPDYDQIQSRRKILRQRMQERLQSADTDHDNSISRTEAEESMPGLARHFDEIDTNHDGIITKEEVQAANDRKSEMLEQQMQQAKSDEAKPLQSKKHGRKDSPQKIRHLKKQQPDAGPAP